MKSRVTLTIAPKVSMRAKNFAKRQGMSMSALVERLLLQATASTSDDRALLESPPSFSKRWAGKIEVTREQDSRSQRLRAKYGLTGDVG